MSKLKKRTRADAIIQMHPPPSHPPINFPTSILMSKVHLQSLMSKLNLPIPDHTTPYQTKPCMRKQEIEGGRKRQMEVRRDRRRQESGGGGRKKQEEEIGEGKRKYELRRWLRWDKIPKSKGSKDQDISKSHSNTSLTLKKVHLVSIYLLSTVKFLLSLKRLPIVAGNISHQPTSNILRILGMNWNTRPLSLQQCSGSLVHLLCIICKVWVGFPP